MRVLFLQQQPCMRALKYAVFAVLSVWFTRRLPGESTAAPAPEQDPAPVALAAT